MANTFKKVIDRLMWVQTPPAPNAHAAAGSLCADLRLDVSRSPFVYQLVSNTILNRFNIVTKAWGLGANLALAGTFGAGVRSVAGCRGHDCGGRNDDKRGAFNGAAHSGGPEHAGEPGRERRVRI